MFLVRVFCVVLFGLLTVAVVSSFNQPPKVRSPLTESLLMNIQNLKNKTAKINQNINQVAPTGQLVQKASQVITNSCNSTAGKINTVTKTIDSAAKDSVNWMKNISVSYTNKGIDLLIEKFQQYAVKNSMDNMTLPDINTKMSGVQVTASGGYFANFASIFKTRGANVTIVDDGVLIRIPLSLATLKAGYNRFTAKMFFMSMTGSFNVNVDRNSILVILRLKAINPCTLNVDRVLVESIEGLSVRFNHSCKICGSLISLLSTELANLMQKTLTKQVQEGIDSGIQRALKQDTFICARFVKATT